MGGYLQLLDILILFRPFFKKQKVFFFKTVFGNYLEIEMMFRNIHFDWYIKLAVMIMALISKSPVLIGLKHLVCSGAQNA